MTKTHVLTVIFGALVILILCSVAVYAVDFTCFDNGECAVVYRWGFWQWFWSSLGW